MVQLIGVPFDANSSFLKGAALAPPRIRLMESDGSANTFSESGLDISEGVAFKDCGDIQFEGTNAEQAFYTIKTNIDALLQNGEKVLALGGDHSVSYPIVAAHLEHYGSLHILHIDAHADLYEDFDNNPYSHASPFARILETGKVKKLTQVGIRTFNTHQREQALRFGVEVIEMKDFDFDFLERLKGPLYVSVDMDGLDPAFAPGVSHHEPGGLSTRQLLKIIQNINVEIIGADIVEYNPTRDIHNMTAMVAYKIFKELIAKM